MYINGSGNVGIGTTSPFSLLHVGTRPEPEQQILSLGSIATVSNDGLTGIDLGANVNANNVVGHINWVNYLGVETIIQHVLTFMLMVLQIVVH
jgi:hypothetical protein